MQLWSVSPLTSLRCRECSPWTTHEERSVQTTWQDEYAATCIAEYHFHTNAKCTHGSRWWVRRFLFIYLFRFSTVIISDYSNYSWVGSCNKCLCCVCIFVQQASCKEKACGSLCDPFNCCNNSVFRENFRPLTSHYLGLTSHKCHLWQHCWGLQMMA